MGRVGFDSHTRYVALIIVTFEGKNGDHRTASYTANDKEQIDKIIRREKSKSNVVKIQVGHKYVYRRRS